MADTESSSAQKRERSEFIRRQRARFELSRRRVSAIFPRSKKQISDSSETESAIKRSQSTPRFPSIPSVLDFEDTSDEVQFQDALKTILQSDSDEKDNTFVKKEVKTEVKSNSKMSVSHTPTTQAGGIPRRPPPPPMGSGRGSPLPPQDGATGGQPPPGQNQTGTSQRTTETGMPQTLESCKIAFNNAVDQFNDIQEKILLFSHHLKQPYDQATGNKIEQYFNQLIIITAKLEKLADQATKQFKYNAIQDEFLTKSNSIGNLMVTCQNYLSKQKPATTPFTPTFQTTRNANPNFTPTSQQIPNQQKFTPSQGLNPNIHFNPNFAQAFQHQNTNQISTQTTYKDIRAATRDYVYHKWKEKWRAVSYCTKKLKKGAFCSYPFIYLF